MANYVSNLTVQVGDNSSATYNIRELFPHVGTCSTAAATAAKEVTIGNFKLYTGAWVVVKFNNTNSAAVASLTLNVDGTGAKPIKYRNANLASASQLIANRYTYFIYDGANYQIVSDFNSDTYDRTSQQTRIYAGTIGVFNYSLCAMDNNQRMQSFTTTSGTGTAKTFNTSASFMYPPVIMYNDANSTYADGTAIANNVLYEQYPSVDLRYSCNVTSTAGFTQYKPVYLECTINSDGTFKLTTTGLTQTFTNGKYYILLGCMYNTSIYQLALFAQHPMFYYDGTHLNGIVYTAAEKTKLSGIANGATKVESSSNGKIKINGKDTTVYSHPTHTAASSGLYKITVDTTGHVSATAAVAKGDIPALDYSKVSISRSLTSGTKIGSITIDGTSTDLYCQTNTNTDTLVSQTFATADNNRPLLMSYYKVGEAAGTAQVAYRNDALYFNPSGGVLRSPRLYLQTTGMPITINLDTLQPAAGENVNVMAVRYKNTDGTATHTVYPIGILGNSATGSGATNNSGVRLGSTNGTTIVCAGESSTTFAAAQAKYNDENLYFVADGAVYMYTNCSNDSTTVTGPWRVGGFTTGTSAITSGRVMITDGTTGGFKASDYTIAKSVPSDAKFSDTVTTVTTSGSGNAVTSITASNGALTVTKGSTFSLSNHTHTTTIAADSGTNQLTLAASTKYKLTTGGTNFIFTTPPNTTYSAGTGLSLSGTTFNHSNSVTAVTTAVFKKITYDAQGHITGTANVTASDLPSHTHSYIPMSGSTDVTGNIKITKASGDTGFYAKRSDTGVEVWMGVGSGGTNHGIYSNKLGKWMMYGDASNVYLNGNATTASSWATARTLTLSGQLTGSVSVKGDANMTLSGWLKKSFIYDETSDFASYAWHKFAEKTITNANEDQTITFIVSKTWGDVPRYSGILTAHIRTGSTKVYESSQFYWQLANANIDPEDFVFVYTNTANTSCKVELWYKQTARYDGWIFTVLKEHSRTSTNNVWTLYTSTGHGSASHTTGTASYASSIAGIQNNTSGTSSNVTGTVAIAHGGTGATDRLNALKALTNENVGTDAQYFLTITNSWGKGGYTSVANAKTVLGLKSAAYTESSDYVPNTQAGMNAAINLLSTGSTTPALTDYYVAQYANGGTTTTSYYRRPISALWNAFKGLITLATTGSGNAVTAVSIANDGDRNRKITVTKGSTFSLSTHTHNYAGSSSAGGPATNVAIARVTKDSKVFPGANKVVFEEYTNGTDYNLPSNHFYHIMSAQGNDTKYGTQLALGMTTTAAYYRVCNNQKWSDWKSLINTDTNTKVTSSANHYTPATVSGQDKSASASGATAAWSIDVVKGVTLNTDGKGHVTGISVTSGKIPANPNTDTKVTQNIVSGSANRPLLMSYYQTGTTTTTAQVVYRNDLIYANPSTGAITANKFYGDITGYGLNAGIYDLITVDNPTFNGAEWMLTSIPSSSGGTSEPSFRRVKTAKFADYVNSNSRTVLFNDSTNTSKSITLSTPPTDTQYLKLYFRSSGNAGQTTMDNSVYSIAEVPYMTDVNLGGILQVAQLSDNMGVLKLTVLAFTIRITNHTLTLTKASYPSRLDGSTVANDTHLSANIIKVVAYR